jgi:DNA mismatch repair protein MutS
VFLHKLQHGPASRSYGIACARLAGVPEPVLARAKAVLEELERGRRKHGRSQLDLFGVPSSAPAPHPVLETLRAADVDRLTPLEALQLLASLKKEL